MSSTQSVVEHHLQALGSGNLEGILADYTDHAVLMTPMGVFKGRDALRGFYTAVLQEWTKPGTTFDLKLMHVDGDCCFIFWNADTPDNSYEGATDTFIVRDGKIVVQTFAGKITPKRVSVGAAS